MSGSRVAALSAIPLLLLAGGTATAQTMGIAGRPRQLAARVASMDTVLTGGHLPGTTDECEQNATHASPFPPTVGTSMVLQAGFSETEIAAVSFVLPASSFPLKVQTVEIILGSVANIDTTVEWSVLVWAGPPNASSPVYVESSDGQFLEHILVPGQSQAPCATSPNPPASAIHFVHQIPPEEPLIIQDNGTHMFTVGFRIDQNNNQSNPCSIPDRCSNAFPATDIGLSSLAGNWLYSATCGGSFCPGGWHSFDQMSFCRPSGDWMMRSVWESVTCAPPTGRCCIPGGGCLVLTQADCGQIQGSAWAGPNTACPGTCTAPCYANCDGSTQSPVLNVQDFTCFLQRYAAGESYANCDQSTQAPVLNVQDFTCFLQSYAAGCP